MQFFLRGFRRDAHPMAVMTGGWWARCRPSITTAPTSITRSTAHRGDPPDRQDADAGGDGLQVRRRPALMYPRNDLSYAGNFMRMMFATPCEEYKGQPGVWCARWTASSSCTPTTSRTPPPPPCACAVRRAPTRSRPSPPAWPACGARRTGWRQRGRRLNMLEDIQKRRRRAQDRRVHQAGEGQELRQADGLRPPRLQELRPARQADARDLLRGARTELGLQNDPLFKLAMALEKIALEDDTSSPQALPERRLLLGLAHPRQRQPRSDQCMPPAA